MVDEDILFAKKIGFTIKKGSKIAGSRWYYFFSTRPIVL